MPTTSNDKPIDAPILILGVSVCLLLGCALYMLGGAIARDGFKNWWEGVTGPVPFTKESSYEVLGK